MVTEDDPQNGFDHVDGHRTVGLVISPYTKRKAVDSTCYNQTGMVKTIELMLGLSRAASEATSNEESEAERLVAEVDALVGVLDETSGKKGKKAFVSDFYLPFYVELKKRGYVEPFVYHAFQGSNLPGVDKWLVLNSTRVREYLAWSESYAWPRVEVK